MNNLIRHSPGNNENGFNPFKNKSSSNDESSSPKVFVIKNEKTEAIKIPKDRIKNLKNASIHFNTHILSNDFPEFKQSLDKNGNFILKKKLFEEKFAEDGYLEFYDRETEKSRKFSIDEVWNGLVDALTTGHIDNAILGRLIADYFMFDTPTFHNPNFEEQSHISRNIGHFPGNRKSRKQRQREQEINRTRRNYKYLTYQDIIDIMGEEEKESAKKRGRLMRNEARGLTSGEQRPGKGTGKKIHNKKGNTRKNPAKIKLQEKDKRRTLRRMKQISKKRQYNRSYNTYNNNNNNEYSE